MTVKDRLTQLARAAGLANPSALARSAGISEGAMRQHIARDRIPHERATDYVDACPGTGATVEWLRFGKGAPPTRAVGGTTSGGGKIVLLQTNPKGNLASRPSSSNGLEKVTGDVTDGRVVVAPTLTDFPVYASVDVGGGVVSLSQDPEYFIARPTWSKSAKDFSFLVWTNVMGPHPGRGDRVEVSTTEPPIEGDLVVAVAGERGRDWKVLLRELVSFTDRHWRLKQYTPEKVDNFERDVWHTCLKVKGINKR